MHRVVHGLVVLAGVMVAVGPGCLDPTEIQIEILTDSCSSLKTVEVYVGGGDGGLAPAPSAVATSCGDASSGDVGVVTLVPSAGIGDEISVVFVGTLFGGSCTPASDADPSCIIAHRDLRFVPHGRQKLSVRLDGACAGVQCPAGQTCDEGVCTSSCQMGCGDDAGGGPDGVGVGDVIGSTDGSATCIAPPPTPAGTAAYVWSFAYPAGMSLQDDQKAVTEPFVSGCSIMPGSVTTPCASYLHVGSTQQPLAPPQPPLTQTHVALTTYYRVASSGVSVVGIEGTNGALRTLIDTNGELTITATVGSNFVTIIDQVPTTDGVWHFLYVDVDAQQRAINAYRDGNLIGKQPLPVGYTNSGPLVAGPSADVDQVQLFAY